MRNKKDKLTTKNLVLKPLENADKNALISLLENPLIKKTYMCPVFNSEEDKNKCFLRLKYISEGKNKILCGIYLNKLLIGFINEVVSNNDTIELGYLITPKQWNKGYATEALSATISEVFRMGYKVVECGHFEENLASGRVMQKCGMQKIAKTETIEYNGTKHICLYYSITNEN